MARIIRSILFSFVVLGTAGLVVACIPLGDGLGDNGDGGNLMGTTPSSSFSEDGAIDFSVLGQGTGNASDKIKPGEMVVEVR